jgi:hypothetical protein
MTPQDLEARFGRAWQIDVLPTWGVAASRKQHPSAEQYQQGYLYVHLSRDCEELAAKIAGQPEYGSTR